MLRFLAAAAVLAGIRRKRASAFHADRTLYKAKLLRTGAAEHGLVPAQKTVADGTVTRVEKCYIQSVFIGTDLLSAVN